MHQFCAVIESCYAAGYSREEILNELQPALEIYGRSPFVRRLQEWPRGYPGDFESIEYLVEQKNRSTPGTVEYYIEHYSLGSLIAQQHRNKIQHQSELICRTLTRSASARILVIAAGSAPDVRQNIGAIASSNATIVLNDIDAEALAYCSEHLGPALARCTLVEGNVLTRINRLANAGPYDLVLCGGLFDYLSDRQISFLIAKARERLIVPDGVLFFTNIATGNPFRSMIEHFGAWFLRERSEQEIRQLVERACGDAVELAVRRDGTGLAHLLEIRFK